MKISEILGHTAILKCHAYDLRYLAIIEKETSGTNHNPWY